MDIAFRKARQSLFSQMFCRAKHRTRLCSYLAPANAGETRYCLQESSSEFVFANVFACAKTPNKTVFSSCSHKRRGDAILPSGKPVRVCLRKCFCLCKNTEQDGVLILLPQQKKRTSKNTCSLFWQGRRDSNTQPTVLETATLPLSHSPRKA